MKKTYINPKADVITLHYTSALLGFSDNDKYGNSIESGTNSDGVADSEGIYWGGSKENSFGGGVNLWDD